MHTDREVTGWYEVWNERSADRADWNGYEACFTDPAGYREFVIAMAAFLLDTLRIGPDDAVIDLGCGTGVIAAEIAKRASSVSGFDYSGVALDVAREKRGRRNLNFEWADLNTVDCGRLRGADKAYDKAYAVGSMLYLDSRERVFRILDELVGNGTDTLLTDLPDESLVDDRKRDYDTARHPHLNFSEREFAERYPHAEVSVHRNLFPGYVNDAVRFTVHIRPARGDGPCR